jgi:hypothetical protein
LPILCNRTLKNRRQFISSHSVERFSKTFFWLGNVATGESSFMRPNGQQSDGAKSGSSRGGTRSGAFSMKNRFLTLEK